MDLDKLARKRGSVKAKLTVFEKFVDNLLIAYPNFLIDDQNLFLELEQRSERSQTFLDEFEDIQGQIDVLSDDFDAQLKEREKFEKSFYAVCSSAKRFLMSSNSIQGSNQCSQSIGPSNNHASNISVGSQLGTQISQQGSQQGYIVGGQVGQVSQQPLSNNVDVTGVRLPVIEMMTFNGEYDKWLEFRDTYQSLIHENAKLADIQKYHYLRAYLGPNILEIIASLEFSASNYQGAWDLICNRFNNNRILIQNHVKALFSMIKIQDESSTNLRKIVDSVAKHLRALKTLNEPTDTWDTLIIYLITTKLDDSTLRKWEEFKAGCTVPTLDDLNTFLKARADLLESLEYSKSDTKQYKPELRSHKKVKSFYGNGELSDQPQTQHKCSFCRKEHYIQSCSDFLKLSVKERVEQAKRKKLCLNCLRYGHIYQRCYSGSCKQCKEKHNTLLHIDKKNENTKSQENTEGNVNLHSRNVQTNQVLLSTVLINVFDKNSKAHAARALLDAGSQSSFLTESFCDKLKLNKMSTNITINSLNETESRCKNKCNLRIQSRLNSFTTEIMCLLVPQITGLLPNFEIDMGNLEIPENIKLSDPSFNVPGHIDMLIGADLFWDLICVGQVKLGKNGPYLQKTKFGWVVSGRVQPNLCATVHCNFVQNTDIEKQLTRFWEIEEFPNVKPFSAEERACEEHFLKNYKRDEAGRFVVTLPLLDSVEKLGDSYKAALQRFQSLERKFARDVEFKKQYHNFITEYHNLGHMAISEDFNETKNDKNIVYYMPHHGVLKETSLTTKLRVVFDASCSTTSNYSLNDLQMVGPTIQSDLFTILLRYRKHDYVICADVEKMYRMCRINPSQKGLQRILWRENPNLPIETYELLTVTYGTKSAPYLAIRCLYQLGLENECEYPNASKSIREDFYVDDLLSGSNSIESTIRLANQITEILAKAGFHLRKWVSNSCKILEGIQTTNKSDIIDLGTHENTKTLGLIWNGQRDCFLYKIGSNFNSRITKRSVLSEISQIFDPLGLLSATIIFAKIILRDIWLDKIDWDQSLSHTLHTRWLQFRDDLPALNNLNIDRQVTCKGFISAEIHGFSDASSHAYGACVYVKSLNNNNEAFVSLTCAKSKVAPLKTQSIPRLELTAALLLSRLVDKVRSSLDLPISKIVYWCDSTIVLGWLRTPPNLLQVFVANRVSAIQDLTNIDSWRHVPTQDNPADYVSRGVKPSALLNLKNYWSGPRWLTSTEDCWPDMQFYDDALPDLRKVATLSLSTDFTNIDFDSYSDLSHLERIIAYCLRFKNNSLKTKENKITGPLRSNEINNASMALIKISQSESFGKEISKLKIHSSLDKGNKLVKLNPFIDEYDILRVGGRLGNSNFKFNKKYPIVLSSKHKLTELLFVREHKRLLHAGPQLLLANIREQFWPIAGRNLARKTFHRCICCFKVKPEPVNPIMGNLPATRVNPAPPFFTTGVDYAGPFFIRDRQGRGFKVTKAYICLFVCFVTRAIHLELVSDLTSEAFIAALRRFVARRGRPAQVFSDNGTNFIGAHNQLKFFGEFLNKNAETLTEQIENEGISWSFIPAHSPHFGGLWEAGVKATKYHLKRVAGNASLTFEKFYTLLVQIEAVLNSRPLCPLSCDPSDYTPLTPSHFIIGRPLVSVADQELMQVPVNRLSHFQQIQSLQQHFWARWSMEYISELQQRSKWRENQEALKINDLVVIKDDHLPTYKWLLGRIECLHPGKDGIARVATIRTKNGNIKRSFAKICPLPID